MIKFAFQWRPAFLLALLFHFSAAMPATAAQGVTDKTVVLGQSAPR